MLNATRLFWMFAVLAALVTALLGAPAHAQVATRDDVRAGNRGDTAVGWCAIQARLTVKSFSLIVDKSRGDGYGRIVCEYADGSEEILPIRVKTKGMGVGVNFPNVYQETTAKMMASGFGIAGGGAQALIGTYIMGRGGVRLVNVGGDIGLNLTANRHGFSIPLTLQTVNAKRTDEAIGFGVDVGYMQISIDPQNLQARHVNKLPVRRPVVRPAMRPIPAMAAIPAPGARPAPIAQPVSRPVMAPVQRPLVSPTLPQERLNVPPEGTGEEIQGSSDGQVSENGPAVDEPTPDQVAQAN